MDFHAVVNCALGPVSSGSITETRLEFPAKAMMGLFSFRHHAQTCLGPTHSPIHWVPAALNSRVKWPVREADHQPAPNIEI
jgi:hypothetical protein